jgi:adenylate kinase
MKNIILIAPPAAGKGTLASMLKEKYNYAHISTGDLLREAASREDELGNKIHEMQAAGQLVTNEIVYQLLEERLTKEDCRNGYILDGYPRSLEQAEEYDNILTRINKDLGIVIILDIDKDILEKRVVGRRMCKDCGFIFNIYSNNLKPQDDHICDKCGGELYQRSDDNLEAFEKRYQTYLDQTEPLIDYYSNRGILYHVDSTDKDIAIVEVEKILSLGD